MRVLLLYPPPWKIASDGEPAYPVREGPPDEFRDGDLDADFWQIPYGLLSLAAQAIRAGHQVKVLNLSAFPWSRVEAVVRSLEADLVGLSCWTANRRGVGYVAEAVRKHHPNAHIVVGGPHATPLAREMLNHHPAIDTVALGESELTFLELLERLGAGDPVEELEGAYRRVNGAIVVGRSRPAVADLDSLASPHAYFDTHIVMTSRGCPWQCTFCGAETTWGRGFRAQSTEYVVEALSSALQRLPVKMMQIKDDTFTTNRKRVLELCRAIRERNLNFLWSCDTRVDVLSDELLREMRLAGCERMSLGVESGSPTILSAVQKKITVDEIIASADLAKKYGIKVRFYMMLGNRGETAETFRETLSFLERARPHQFIFSCLSIYPGTVDFRDAEKAGWLDREVYFTGSFQELKVPFDASDEDTRTMMDWFEENSGLCNLHSATIEECLTVLEHLGDHHAAHMDLAGAYYRSGEFDSAERHALRALELGYPAPGLAYNYVACVAAQRRDLERLQDALRNAVRLDPQHFVVAKNAHTFRDWLKLGGPVKGLPLNLVGEHEFQLFERTVQPSLPGPLPDDYCQWDAALPFAAASVPMRDRDAVGSRAPFASRTRLKVIVDTD